VRENWFLGLTKHGATFTQSQPCCQPAISARFRVGWNLHEVWRAFLVRPFARAFTVKRRLREVTAGEICAVARDFFRPERLNLALVSPLTTHHCNTVIP
jgi:hypothetical protein